MSNVMRSLKRGMNQKIEKVIETNKKILIHGAMKYRCKDCGKEWWMFLEKGIEEPGDDHKPSPFAITCGCGGVAYDVSGYCSIPDEDKIHDGYAELPDGESYFANKRESDCGVPVVK